MISWKTVAAWIGALVVTTVLTWQIVGIADSRVGDTPIVVASLSSSTTSTSAPPATTTPPPTTTSSVPTTTSSTSTSSSNPTTSSTTSASWSVRNISSPGGTVVVRYRPGEVELQAATPAAGFSVEVDDAGPPKVRVEFEGDDTDVRVEAEWDDGGLVVDIDD